MACSSFDLSKVPSSSPAPRMRVADSELGWSEGKLTIFDDSFDHEVWFENAERDSGKVSSIMFLKLGVWKNYFFFVFIQEP